VSTTDAGNEAAVRILARTGTDTVTALLAQHGNRDGRCDYCRTPTPWPCDLARLCQAALLLHPGPPSPRTWLRRRVMQYRERPTISLVAAQGDGPQVTGGRAGVSQ
jgi:hypothetical protein